MKKILLDIYLAKNLGDDIFLDLFAKKYPDAEITLTYPGKDYDDYLKNYSNVSAFPYKTTDKFLRRLKIYNKLVDFEWMAKEFDLLVFIGGGIFREEPEYESSLFEYRNNLVSRFMDAEKPSFFLGCNFGPYTSKGFIDKHTALFKKCKDVCFRDTASFDLFKNLGNVRYAPDMVWGDDLDETGITNSDEQILGISVINPRHKPGLEQYYESYIQSQVKAIHGAIARSQKIHLFSFCEQEGDLLVIKDIESRLDKSDLEYVKVFNYDGNINKYIEEIGKVSELIAARFHSIIIGILLKIKVIPVIYNIKTKNLLSDIRFKNYFVDFTELNLLDEGIGRNNYINPDISRFRNGAMEHFTLLNEQFN